MMVLPSDNFSVSTADGVCTAVTKWATERWHNGSAGGVKAVQWLG